MNLHGSIKELQSAIVKLYLELEQHFSENTLIRELWNTMAHDVSQQIRSLDMLPQSFWTQLKKEPNAPAADAVAGSRQQSVDIEGDISLRLCLDRVLLLEEPVIVKIYAPLIRRLRENLTEPALDFYIMVKAHLARITRVTQSFSGDPVLIQRANSLLQAFEKEVQEHHAELRLPKLPKPQAVQPPAAKEAAKKSKKAPAKSRPLAKHAEALRGRTKTLVKKVSLPKRRARR
jgi:hypothetical protein